MRTRPLTPEAFVKGRDFAEQLLKDGTPLKTAKAALGQLMVTEAFSSNGKQKKATAKQIGISRQWLRSVLHQTERKSGRLIPEQRSRN